MHRLVPIHLLTSEFSRCRWAMAAVAGILGQEILGVQPVWFNAGAKEYIFPATALTAIEFLTLGALELKRYRGWKAHKTVSPHPLHRNASNRRSNILVRQFFSVADVQVASLGESFRWIIQCGHTYAFGFVLNSCFGSDFRDMMSVKTQAAACFDRWQILKLHWSICSQASSTRTPLTPWASTPLRIK